MATAFTAELKGLDRLRDLVPKLVPAAHEARKRTVQRMGLAMEARLTRAATGEILHVRSDAYRSAIGSSPVADTGAGVEVHTGIRAGAASKYAAVQEDGAHITPKNGKYLWIPFGDALTASGVPRYSGPGDPELEGADTAFIFPKGKNPLFGIRDENDEFQGLFVGVTSVDVPARHPVERSFDDVAPQMDAIGQEELDRAVLLALA